MKFLLEKAKAGHANDIRCLVNSAYRGDIGWTKETELVGGERVAVAEIQGYIDDPDAHLLVNVEKGEVLACICIEKKGRDAYIGLFAVAPRLQGLGVGKQVLSQAERYASETLSVDKYVMVVVSQREELISYYERRGYTRLGKTESYPEHLEVGTPLKRGLMIEYLEKSVKG
ncbi:GNAT family N-acetyltransferase [Pseudomonadota bacterium]